MPRDVLVVLDEAYDEYLDAGAARAERAWLGEHPEPGRVAHLFQGLRPGRPARRLRPLHAAVSDLLNRVRQPFNVNAIAQAAALAALADTAFVAESAALNRAGMPS